MSGRPAVVVRKTLGSFTSAGKSARTRVTASRTSFTASITFFSRLNSTVMTTMPSNIFVYRFLIPCSVAIEFSILRATSVSRVAGAAPGKLASTVTMGNSMSGKSCTPIARNDNTPAIDSRINSRIAGIGCRIEKAEKFIASPILLQTFWLIALRQPRSRHRY